MIREATIKDTEAIFEMSVKFLEESGTTKRVPYDVVDLTKWIMAMLQHPESVILVYEDKEGIKGSVAGTVMTHYINSDYKVSNEIAWWVHPEYRGRVGKPLLEAFEKWSKEMGATQVVVSSLEAIHPEVIRKVYTKLGYEEIEHTFIKGV